MYICVIITNLYSIYLVQSGALETTTNIVSTFPLDIWGGTDGIGLLWSGLLQTVKFNSGK